MEKLLLFKLLSQADLKRFVKVQNKGIAPYEWTRTETISLTEPEMRQVEYLQAHLLNYDAHLVNEATLWARAIYPLLLLAEQGDIQAWSEISLQAQYPKFQLDGIADGVLARGDAGIVVSPYLVVVETKTGIDGQNPVFQLYGQLLAVAHLNWEENPQDSQEMFGCYTIADTWKFVRAVVTNLDSDLPTLQLEYSREYAEKLEAETIFKILKQIVAKHLEPVVD
jgi:hypothetical protein